MDACILHKLSLRSKVFVPMGLWRSLETAGFGPKAKCQMKIKAESKLLLKILKESVEYSVKSVVVCPEPWTVVRMCGLSIGAERVQTRLCGKYHQTFVVLTRAVGGLAPRVWPAWPHNTICA